MNDRKVRMYSPPKRVPSGTLHNTLHTPARSFMTTLQDSVFRRYSLCAGIDALPSVPWGGAASTTASFPAIDLSMSTAKLLQPMWKASISSSSFCDFWELDWPGVRAVRIRALTGCLATLRSVDSANLTLLKDKLYETQQRFSMAQQLYEQNQNILHTCRQEAIRDVALLGHASRKLLGELPLEEAPNWPGLLSNVPSHLPDGELQAVHKQVLRHYKQLFFSALRFYITYLRNMQRLTAAVIVENDNYMLVRAALLTWRKLFKYKRQLIRIDTVFCKILDTRRKQAYFSRWLNILRASTAVRKEKLLRRLLRDSMTGSNISYPEPSILSSSSVIQPEPFGAIATEKVKTSYLNRLYNIFIAVGTPLNEQTRAFLALTDFSIIINLIVKVSRLRRKLSAQPINFPSLEKMPSLRSLKSMVQEAQTRANLEAFGATYFTVRLLQKTFRGLRRVFYQSLLQRLAIMYAIHIERAHVIKTLSVCLHIQRQRMMESRRFVLLRVSFSGLLRGYKELVSSKYAKADQFHDTLLLWIAWGSALRLLQLYQDLEKRARPLLDRSATKCKKETLRSLKLGYLCSTFRASHIDNLRNFRYRSIFWLVYMVSLQRRSLRHIMVTVAFPRYKNLISCESYYASRTYQRDICLIYLQRWREVALSTQEAQRLHSLAQRGDAFYNTRLLSFVFKLLVIKYQQKTESRLFYYRRQVDLARNALLQWHARLHNLRKVTYLGTVLRGILERYTAKYARVVFESTFYFWRDYIHACSLYNTTLQRRTFRLLCSRSVIIRYLYISDCHYRTSVMRRVYNVLVVRHQYSCLLEKLDRRYNYRLLRIHLFRWRSKRFLLLRNMEQAEKFYKYHLLSRICKILEFVAVRSKIYMDARIIGQRYIKFFYFRRWKSILRASREAIYLEKRADVFYSGLLELWATKIIHNPRAVTDIPVLCLVSRTNKELLDSGLIGNIVLSSKVLKAHLIVENQLLLMVFDEWRYAIIRRRRFISMRGPN